MSAPILLSCDVIGCTRQAAWTRSQTDGDAECLCHICWSRLRLKDPASAFTFVRNHSRERHRKLERSAALQVEEPAIIQSRP